MQEGKEFLEQEAPELVKTPKGKEGVETRGKTQARATIDSLLSTTKVCYLSSLSPLSPFSHILQKLEELTDVERKKEENKLKMVFRLFDKDKDGYLDADELSGAMKYVLSLLFSSLSSRLFSSLMLIL